ncbi:hypothetical protein [Williamsia sp. CHRR-6]|uniref:hypothetical protein n=1 Tax=Williamsia sp. CHRR-6 TaxID=2835871 RepID=UPI001BDB53AE|nr:hypothetical protein [Williamsia sp. CHRR-6]MBT0565949.1 hypothetical protein [Williamsia sp. CHRR-6]
MNTFPVPVSAAPAAVSSDLMTARSELAAGSAVVLGNPAPLAWVVAATDPRVVNSAKGRPLEQSVALWVHTAETVDAVIDLCAVVDRPLVDHLLVEERATVLLPVRPGAAIPQWMAPAHRDGWVLLFGSRWPGTSAVLDGHRVVYVSSANRTGSAAAVDMGSARSMFGESVCIHDCGAGAQVTDVNRRSTTTVRVQPDGQLTLHRPGAQDGRWPDPQSYLDHLRTAYRAKPT